MYSEQFYDLIHRGKKIKDLQIKTPFFWDLNSVILPENQDVVFENCVFQEDFHILEMKLPEGVLKFINCIFHKNLRIYKTHDLFLIEFEDTSLKRVFLHECQSLGINIENTEVSDSLVIVDCKAEELDIVASKNEKKINEISLSSKDIELTVIETNDQIGKLALRAFQKLELTGNLEELEIDTNTFEYLNYTNFSKKDYNTLNSLIFENQNISGSILMEELHIAHLNFDNVTSTDGSVRLNQIKIDKAEFENVNIDSFIWNQVHFTNELFIERCNFNQLQFSNVQWLKNKQVSDSFLEDKIKCCYGLRKHWLKEENVFNERDLMDLRYERETYKQLKAAALSNHLNIEALDFYRNEMRLYWKEVRIAGGIPIQNRILVFLNRWSSDFGQNWLLPIGWLFLFQAFWFSCLISWSYCINSFSGEQELTEYFRLLNPTHEVPCYVSTGFGYLTDIIMRVSVAYFIYHIIRATRKYGKV